MPTLPRLRLNRRIATISSSHSCGTGAHKTATCSTHRRPAAGCAAAFTAQLLVPLLIFTQFARTTGVRAGGSETCYCMRLRPVRAVVILALRSLRTGGLRGGSGAHDEDVQCVCWGLGLRMDAHGVCKGLTALIWMMMNKRKRTCKMRGARGGRRKVLPLTLLQQPGYRKEA